MHNNVSDFIKRICFTRCGKTSHQVLILQQD